MGAWREGVVVAAAEAMKGRGYEVQGFVCEQGVLGNCVGNRSAC